MAFLTIFPTSLLMLVSAFDFCTEYFIIGKDGVDVIVNNFE
jgi:hypothetical protein